MSTQPALERVPENELARCLQSGDASARSSLDLREAHLAGVDLTGVDLSDLDLRGADLHGANLTGSRLVGTNLRDAILLDATLTGAELLGADLTKADLSGCHAEGAGFGGAELSGAALRNARLRGSSFTQASLHGATFRGADLHEVRMCEADLSEADFWRADLRGADLSEACVERAVFSHADLRGARISNLAGFESADWIGVDLRDLDLRGAVRIRRFILDENYLHEFRSSGRSAAILHAAWSITSDCGRSFTRWSLWTAAIVGLFAALFGLVNVDYGDYPTALSPLYYSVVTLTTLGYGDVVPASPMAQVLAMLEVVIGYLALGGLISIFANKMARRAE